MSLVRWNSRNDLANATGDFDDLLKNFWYSEDSFMSKFNPSVDIEENDDAFHFHAELPGLEKDNVKISLKDNILTIRGEKESRKKNEKSNFHRIETTSGKFQRCFKLPYNVKQESIKAEFKNGVLNISIPKAEEAKPREISIV
ncbi:MAG: Hsp20/alpha crystallin family protein [Candidatus Marinimicrobia bacterium]|nr:Hsp20/alpha crystallin family protein [Candidatus Neomarinimicrobiota bacterium]